MVSGERLKITLSGGTPWGFRLQGGGNFPLEVAKIRKRSHAFEGGLREGDVVLSINGYPLSGRSHQSAMDIVDMASNVLSFEIARNGSGQAASQPLDPQRQPRITMVSGNENAGPGLVSSAQSNYITQDGNVRTDVHTDEYVMKSPSGRTITKTVTEQRVTKFPPSGGLSPVPDGGHVSRSPNRSPVMWSPDALSPSTSARSPLMWQPPSQSSQPAPQPRPHSHSPSQASRSPSQQSRSPLMWQPPSMQTRTQPEPVMPQSKSPVMWKPKSPSRSPAPPPGSHSRSPSGQRGAGKENMDPMMLSEQAKWEARHSHELETARLATNYLDKKMAYAPPTASDPKYPMFEIPKPDWQPPKIVEPPEDIPEKKVPPPVAPKPLVEGTPFHPAEEIIAGTDRHRPGMIRPPAQPNTLPAPPPPPMPHSPSSPSPASMPAVPFPKKFQPGYASTPSHPEEEERHRPDHLPVFGPKVMFGLDDDSALPMSPDRSDQISDISSLDKKKIFSDSAFYDDATHRFPTIDEQMSMCKRIAESLTSAANKRARGARMFANRKRKANKWIHDQCVELGVCGFSSSAGDVADLDELDSELYYDDGGSKPLFTFRIPNLAAQVTEGERMSLSKQEFERLRLVAPKSDHNAVSPNQCFSIAADLHRGGKNKGAKLFQKRQQRVEKFVIDETNVNRAPMTPTKLQQIIQSPNQPQKSPWEAAARGNVHQAFDSAPGYSSTMPRVPKHSLAAENQPRRLEGHNFNTKARGWGGAGPSSQQQSYYRGIDHLETSSETDVRSDSHMHQSASWDEDQATPPQPSTSKFGDYNRRMKAWPGSGQPAQVLPSVTPHSEQTNYNSLPRGFGGSRPESSSLGYCDL